MPQIPLTKPSVQSHAERRHYRDQEQWEIEHKLISNNTDILPQKGVYAQDYINQTNHPVAVTQEPRKIKRKGISALTDLEKYEQQSLKIGNPTPQEANKLLYTSTYQIAFSNTHPIEPPKHFRYINEQAVPSISKDYSTLYQKSFTAKMIESKILRPEQRFKMSKSLHQPATHGLSIKSILDGDRKTRSETAYDTEYRDFQTMEKQKRVTVGSLRLPIFPANPKAMLKYQEWKNMP